MNLGKKYKQLFEGKLRSNDSGLLNEAWIEPEKSDFSTRNKIGKIDPNLRVKVLNHNETSDDAIDFEGTINGKPWTASKEYMRDGAIFTSVYDTPTQDTIEEDDPEYDAIITAIDDYMEKKNLAK